MKLKPSDSIVSIRNEFDRPIRFDDSTFGESLFVLRDSMGIVGIVRADTWEEAHDIAEDEIYPEADQTWEDIAIECECVPEKLQDDACFQEAYGLRPNGPNKRDTMRHGIYEKDLNGNSLDLLTDDLIHMLRLEIAIMEDEP